MPRLDERRPTLEEMRAALAASFGYEDYATFRQEVERKLGRSVLQRLEREIEKRCAAPAKD